MSMMEQETFFILADYVYSNYTLDQKSSYSSALKEERLSYKIMLKTFPLVFEIKCLHKYYGLRLIPHFLYGYKCL